MKNIAMFLMKHFANLTATIGSVTWKTQNTPTGWGCRSTHSKGTGYIGRLARQRSNTCTTTDVEKLLAAKSRRTLRGRKRYTIQLRSVAQNNASITKQCRHIIHSRHGWLK